MKPRPTILIDNNALSDRQLPARANGKAIYLCDTVFLELFSKGRWERSVQSCLAPLAPFASSVRVAPNLAALLKRELKTGNSTITIEGDPEVQRRIAGILLACEREPELVVEYFRQNQHQAVGERNRRIQGLGIDKDTSLDIMERLKRRIDERVLARLRQQPESIPQELESFKAETFSCVESLVSRLSCKNSSRLSSGPSCWMRLLLADLCLAVRRTQQPSFENSDDDILHSEHADREIVILGTYCDEIFTVDRGAIWLDTALRALLKKWC
jgi:hypothetical protein